MDSTCAALTDTARERWLVELEAMTGDHRLQKNNIYLVFLGVDRFYLPMTKNNIANN